MHIIKRTVSPVTRSSTALSAARRGRPTTKRATTRSVAGHRIMQIQSGHTIWAQTVLIYVERPHLSRLDNVAMVTRRGGSVDRSEPRASRGRSIRRRATGLPRRGVDDGVMCFPNSYCSFSSARLVSLTAAATVAASVERRWSELTRRR